MATTTQTLKKKKNKSMCGIIMPISAIGECSETHWEEVKGIIIKAVEDAGYKADIVSNSDESGVIQKTIVQNLYDNEIVVCDVSGKNPNVMFELGMRLAFDKPTIIVMDDKTNYTFDISVIEHIEYPRDLNYYKIVDFQKKLTEKIKATAEAAKDPNYTTFLKHFGEFKVANIEHKEGSINDVVIAKLDNLTQQMTDIRRERNSILARRFYDNSTPLTLTDILNQQTFDSLDSDRKISSSVKIL